MRPWYACLAMVTDEQRAALARRWLRQFHESFTLSEHHAFMRECTPYGGSDVEGFMNEVAEVAHTRELRQEYRAMAKASPAAPAKTAPAVKAAPAKQEAKQAPPPREPKVASTARIQWLVKENPKRVGSKSHERFESYFGSKTVAAFLEAGGTRADLANDIGKEYMSVTE